MSDRKGNEKSIWILFTKNIRIVINKNPPQYFCKHREGI